ncbi:type II toxin-antitoxin system RelB family antitoxin [Mammaliicoccus sp. Dog046]|uniref:type II toxin-antitoxin system RelB family antitoxin n=1 Tax=Mammaliicoccus sp. Dog046 TaxID=3034233 RepID=UPI002B261135|nr:DUF6290 family protein [Mammaliicoccus sp. Dog046]WQK86592.1 DUF6290 family protein [Mammaliicoccus sp. Dog046]
MATITICVSDDEKKFLEYMSEFLGISLSKLIKDYTIDELEDIYDSKVGDIAFKEYQKSSNDTVSIEEVMKQWKVK